MGGVAAGVKFYAAYPMSPSTGVLMWMAAHARELGIMVRQGEGGIGGMKMVIGGGDTGRRAGCAAFGGGVPPFNQEGGTGAAEPRTGACGGCHTAGTPP